MLPKNPKMLFKCFVVMPITGVLYFFVAGAIGCMVFGSLLSFSRHALIIPLAGFSSMGLVIGTMSGIDFFRRYRRIVALLSAESAEAWESILPQEQMGGPDDLMISIMKKMRGTYTASVHEAITVWFFVIFFGIAGPALHIFLLHEKGFPYAPFSIEHFAALLIVLILPAVAIHLYIQWGRTFEFNGGSIIERDWSGHELSVLPIDEIDSIITESEAFIVIAGDKRMKIHMYNQLRSEMRRIVKYTD